MPRRPKNKTKSAGVSLEVPVLEYLDRLADQQDRTRSFVINLIIREHADRHGTPIHEIPIETNVQSAH